MIYHDDSNYNYSHDGISFDTSSDRYCYIKTKAWLKGQRQQKQHQNHDMVTALNQTAYLLSRLVMIFLSIHHPTRNNGHKNVNSGDRTSGSTPYCSGNNRATTPTNTNTTTTTMIENETRTTMIVDDVDHDYDGYNNVDTIREQQRQQQQQHQQLPFSVVSFEDTTTTPASTDIAPRTTTTIQSHNLPPSFPPQQLQLHQPYESCSSQNTTPSSSHHSPLLPSPNNTPHDDSLLMTDETEQDEKIVPPPLVNLMGQFLMIHPASIPVRDTTTTTTATSTLSEDRHSLEITVVDLAKHCQDLLPKNIIPHFIQKVVLPSYHHHHHNNNNNNNNQKSGATSHDAFVVSDGAIISTEGSVPISDEKKNGGSGTNVISSTTPTSLSSSLSTTTQPIFSNTTPFTTILPSTTTRTTTCIPVDEFHGFIMDALCGVCRVSKLSLEVFHDFTYVWTSAMEHTMVSSAILRSHQRKEQSTKDIMMMTAKQCAWKLTCLYTLCGRTFKVRRERLVYTAASIGLLCMLPFLHTNTTTTKRNSQNNDRDKNDDDGKKNRNKVKERTQDHTIMTHGSTNTMEPMADDNIMSASNMTLSVDRHQKQQEQQTRPCEMNWKTQHALHQHQHHHQPMSILDKNMNENRTMIRIPQEDQPYDTSIMAITPSSSQRGTEDSTKRMMTINNHDGRLGLTPTGESALVEEKSSCTSTNSSMTTPTTTTEGVDCGGDVDTINNKKQTQELIEQGEHVSRSDKDSKRQMEQQGANTTKRYKTSTMEDEAIAALSMMLKTSPSSPVTSTAPITNTTKNTSPPRAQETQIFQNEILQLILNSANTLNQYFEQNPWTTKQKNAIIRKPLVRYEVKNEIVNLAAQAVACIKDSTRSMTEMDRMVLKNDNTHHDMGELLIKRLENIISVDDIPNLVSVQRIEETICATRNYQQKQQLVLNKTEHQEQHPKQSNVSTLLSPNNRTIQKHANLSMTKESEKKEHQQQQQQQLCTPYPAKRLGPIEETIRAARMQQQRQLKQLPQQQVKQVKARLGLRFIDESRLVEESAQYIDKIVHTAKSVFERIARERHVAFVLKHNPIPIEPSLPQKVMQQQEQHQVLPPLSIASRTQLAAPVTPQNASMTLPMKTQSMVADGLASLTSAGQELLRVEAAIAQQKLNEWCQSILIAPYAKPSKRLMLYFESSDHEFMRQRVKHNKSNPAVQLLVPLVGWRDVIIPVLNHVVFRLTEDAIKGGQDPYPMLVDVTGNVTLYDMTNPDKRLCTALIVFYYHALESLIFNETARLKTAAHPSIVQSESFHRALLSCCYLCVVKAFEDSDDVLQLTVRHTDLDVIGAIAVMESTPYSFLRVSESFCRAMRLADDEGGKLNSHITRVPKLLMDHITSCEGILLDSYIWMGESTLGEDGNVMKAIEEMQSTARTWTSISWPPPDLQPSLPEEVEDCDPSCLFFSDQGKFSCPSHRFAVYVVRRLLRIVYSRITKLCGALAIDDKLPVSSHTYVAFRYMMRHHMHLLYDRHVDQLLLCALYSVCKLLKYEPAFSFSTIIDAYTKVRGKDMGEKFCSRIVRQVRLSGLQDQQQFGNIIHLYNQVFVPEMKNHLLLSKSLARATAWLEQYYQQSRRDKCILHGDFVHQDSATALYKTDAAFGSQGYLPVWSGNVCVHVRPGTSSRWMKNNIVDEGENGKGCYTFAAPQRGVLDEINQNLARPSSSSSSHLLKSEMTFQEYITANAVSAED